MSVDHKRIAEAMKVRLETCPDAKARRCDALCADCPALNPEAGFVAAKGSEQFIGMRAQINKAELDRVYESVKSDVASAPEYMFRATPVASTVATKDSVQAAEEAYPAWPEAQRHFLAGVRWARSQSDE